MFGLRYKARPLVWEGDSRVDLLEVYAPWALETCSKVCAVEGVACVVRQDAAPGGSFTHADLLPVGDLTDAEGNPVNALRNVNHWVAAVYTGGGDEAAVAAEPLNQFYHKMDRFVLGTVCDGCCGMDVMTQMLEWPQTAESRGRLRKELYEYLMSRHRDCLLYTSPSPRDAS